MIYFFGSNFYKINFKKFSILLMQRLYICFHRTRGVKTYILLSLQHNYNRSRKTRKYNKQTKQFQTELENCFYIFCFLAKKTLNLIVQTIIYKTKLRIKYFALIKKKFLFLSCRGYIIVCIGGGGVKTCILLSLQQNYNRIRKTRKYNKPTKQF